MSPPVSTILGSPVVGEFKGWFSNLFNWKPQTYVLYSPDDMLATRNETTRLLEQFGVTVALEDGDANGWGMLRCRVDDGADGSAGSAIQKQSRFRIEFSSMLGNGPYSLQTQPQASHRLSQHPGALSPNPAHAPNGYSNPSRASTMMQRNVMAGPGYACAIVLVQEKGSVATFRTVYRRLKQEWLLGSALQSPGLSPGDGTTPLMEHAHRFMA